MNASDASKPRVAKPEIVEESILDEIEEVLVLCDMYAPSADDRLPIVKPDVRGTTCGADLIWSSFAGSRCDHGEWSGAQSSTGAPHLSPLDWETIERNYPSEFPQSHQSYELEDADEFGFRRPNPIEHPYGADPYAEGNEHLDMNKYDG